MRNSWNLKALIFENTLVRFSWGLEPSSWYRLQRSVLVAISPCLLLIGGSFLSLHLYSRTLLASPPPKFIPFELLISSIVGGGFVAVCVLIFLQQINGRVTRKGGPLWNELLLTGLGPQEIVVGSGLPHLAGLAAFLAIYPPLTFGFYVFRSSYAFPDMLALTCGIGAISFIAINCTIFDIAAQAHSHSTYVRLILGCVLGPISSPLLWGGLVSIDPWDMTLLIPVEAISWRLRMIYPFYLWRKAIEPAQEN